MSCSSRKGSSLRRRLSWSNGKVGHAVIIPLFSDLAFKPSELHRSTPSSSWRPVHALNCLRTRLSTAWNCNTSAYIYFSLMKWLYIYTLFPHRAVIKLPLSCLQKRFYESIWLFLGTGFHFCKICIFLHSRHKIFWEWNRNKILVI